MNQPSASPLINSPAPANALPSGRGLLIARVGWIALTLFLLALNAISIPGYAAALQSVCHHGAQCNSVQLRPDDVRLLHQLGLTPAFLAAYNIAQIAMMIVVYFALAALIFWRRSDDRMALFSAYVLVLFAGTIGLTANLQYGLESPFLYALAAVLATIGSVAFTIYFFLFPTGHFVPRWTGWCVPIATLLWAWNNFFPPPVGSTNNAVLNFSIFALLVCGVIAQIYRYRRVSTPRERQQTKWVVYGFSIGILTFVLAISLGSTLTPPSQQQSQVITILVPDTISYACFLVIPISIAIAILRSRLYDINTIINRTLVYGLLTAVLGVLYVGLIIGLESLVGLFATQSARPFVLVVSTLAIYVLFQPLRRRIQRIIDRRFYRRKYDAAKTLESFSATLRQEVDLEQLRKQLVAVVQETMQPAHVSLWLRPSALDRKDQATWRSTPPAP